MAQKLMYDQVLQVRLDGGRGIMSSFRNLVASVFSDVGTRRNITRFERAILS